MIIMRMRKSPFKKGKEEFKEKTSVDHGIDKDKNDDEAVENGT